MADIDPDGEMQTDDPTDWSVMDTRVNSYQHFPRVKEVSAARLARAGFYFTGEVDRVRCFSCTQTLGNWSQGDDPLLRHLQASPDCTFLRCTHRGTPMPNGVAHDDERAEELEFRLRSGEVVDEPAYPLLPLMRGEGARLASFRDWPAGLPVRPAALAQAGLFYLGESDRVRCFCCGGMLAGWEPGDGAWDEHSKHFPNCLFILGHDVGNEPLALSPQRPGGQDGGMESLAERLMSFQGGQHPIDHERLARAGFYNAGHGDRVICFRCGGGVKGWDPEEDPWEEHAKHYPGCSFLLEEKGQEFISSVQLRDPKCRQPMASHQNGFSKHEAAASGQQVAMARRAVEMGFDAAAVQSAMQARLSGTGQGYPSLELLVQDLIGGSRAGADPEAQLETQEEDPLQKLEKLQRERQCKICLDRDISIVFIPCGHLATCQPCSGALAKCPICCATITQKVKTYMS